jgi:16S rRNA (cytidine1402-2'-O)-methyltransferase
MSEHAQPARPGTLYIVATPIGNLRDITLRALDILGSVDLVAAEDTRVTSGLLAAHGIQAKLYAYHEHNERTATPDLVAKLRAGTRIALVSDAGTPGISDPGARLVDAARQAGLPVVPLPGASAVATLMSVAGDIGDHWLFHGFLAHKAAARRREIEALRALPYPIVFYESPHRIVECIDDLLAVLGPERRLVLARELTKLFETVHACALGDAPAWLAEDPNRQRGEFVLLVSGATPDVDSADTQARALLAILLDELSPSQAARLAARITGQRKNALYDLAQTMKPE